MNPICQQCGTPNISGAAFCDNCGSQFLSGDSSGNSTLAPTQVPPSPPVVVASAGPSPLARATTCSICGVPYQAGEAYCGNCGAPLPQASSSPPVVNYPAPPVMTPVAAAGNICPQCGTPNEASSVFCDNCGVSQSAPTPGVYASGGVYPPPPPPPPVTYPPAPPIPYPQPQSQGNYGNPPMPPVHVLPQNQSNYPPPNPNPYEQRPQSASTPRLVLQANNVVLPFPAGKTVLIIGREDAVSEHFPELDLGPYGAEQLGVSRSHARFTVQGNQVFIEDMQAVNYTFVNRQKLAPHTRHILQNGDEIRLSKMVLLFYLQ